MSSEYREPKEQQRTMWVHSEPTIQAKAALLRGSSAQYCIEVMKMNEDAARRKWFNNVLYTSDNVGWYHATATPQSPMQVPLHLIEQNDAVKLPENYTECCLKNRSIYFTRCVEEYFDYGLSVSW